MNKYKIYNSTNKNSVPTGCDGSYEIEADSMKVNETGQVCFYNYIDTNTNHPIIPDKELIAVFPAGCAVIKLHEGSAEIDHPTQKLMDDLNEVHDYDYKVPAGNANTVYNDTQDDETKLDEEFFKKVGDPFKKPNEPIL